MFEDYKRLVRAHYLQRLAEGNLPNDLAVPTTGKIKRECLKVYTQRFRVGDKSFINDFFGPAENGTTHGTIISAVDPDRFRPIVNYLRGITSDPDDIHIELLAWLTDYEPRPFRFDTFRPQIIPPQQQPPTIAAPGTPQPTTIQGTPDTQMANEQWYKNRYIRWSGLACTGVIITLLISYFIGTNDGGYGTSKQCMIWNGDHYEAIGCNQKVFGKQLIALDTLKLANFRLITRPDTLTAYSVDKVWYVKINSLPEYFTGPGKHPLYPEKNLKPLSILILRKYSGVR